MSELVPYDVEPPTEDELELQIHGDRQSPERVLRISRPVNGLVRVREWSSEDWSLMTERELAAEALLEAIEQAARGRRRLSQELYRVRLWLTGNAS